MIIMAVSNNAKFFLNFGLNVNISDLHSFFTRVQVLEYFHNKRDIKFLTLAKTQNLYIHFTDMNNFHVAEDPTIPMIN